jgi:hypothetical protein
VLHRAGEAKRLAKAKRNVLVLAQIKENKQPLPSRGLSEHAQRLAVLLNERSATGLDSDVFLGADMVSEALPMTDDELAMAADELEEKEWVKLLKTSGMGKAGFTEISPTAKLFLETDSPLKGWNPRNDAKTLAATLVDMGDDRGADLATLDKALGWGPRRLNPAAHYLATNGYADHIEVMGTHPYVYAALIVTARTRRFAQES